MAELKQRAHEEGRQEGLSQGRRQGIRQGRAEGERAILKRQLRKRFGELPPAVGMRFTGALPADLEAWAENVLDAATLDEVFGPGLYLKGLVGDYPREALAFFAPEEAKDAASATRVGPVREEWMLGGHYRWLDVPLLVEWGDDRREVVLFTFEEERDCNRFPPDRLAQCCLSLAETFRTDLVVPVVVFLRGPAPERPARSTERRDYLTFDCLTVALGEMDAERWLDSDNVVARVCLPTMCSPASRRVDVYASAARGLLDLEPDVGRRAKYTDFIDICAEPTGKERRRYRELHPEEHDIMTALNRDARDQGRREGLHAVLGRLLRRRFGALPYAVDARLCGASAADLEAWIDNVWGAGRLDDVFGPGWRAG